MARITHYRDLEIWQEAMSVCEEIYRLTEEFPRREHFGLAAHLRKTSVSIPSNIAEGFVRKHAKESRQFFSIAISSLAELDTQIMLSNRMGYLPDDKCVDLIEKTDRLGRKTTRFYQCIRT